MAVFVVIPMVNTGKNQTLNVTRLALVTLVFCVVVIGEITSIA